MTKSSFPWLHRTSISKLFDAWIHRHESIKSFRRLLENISKNSAVNNRLIKAYAQAFDTYKIIAAEEKLDTWTYFLHFSTEAFINSSNVAILSDLETSKLSSMFVDAVIARTMFVGSADSPTKPAARYLQQYILKQRPDLVAHYMYRMDEATVLSIMPDLWNAWLTVSTLIEDPLERQSHIQNWLDRYLAPERTAPVVADLSGLSDFSNDYTSPNS